MAAKHNGALLIPGVQTVLVEPKATISPRSTAWTAVEGEGISSLRVAKWAADCTALAVHAVATVTHFADAAVEPFAPLVNRAAAEVHAAAFIAHSSPLSTIVSSATGGARHAATAVFEHSSAAGLQVVSPLMHFIPVETPHSVANVAQGSTTLSIVHNKPGHVVLLMLHWSDTAWQLAI